jgi:hypothetical protein
VRVLGAGRVEQRRGGGGGLGAGRLPKAEQQQRSARVCEGARGREGREQKLQKSELFLQNSHRGAPKPGKGKGEKN